MGKPGWAVPLALRISCWFTRLPEKGEPTPVSLSSTDMRDTAAESGKISAQSLDTESGAELKGLKLQFHPNWDLKDFLEDNGSVRPVN